MVEDHHARRVCRLPAPGRSRDRRRRSRLPRRVHGSRNGPSQVVANGRGADFLMTVTQPPEVDDSFFEELMRSVETELTTLKEVLEAVAE